MPAEHESTNLALLEQQLANLSDLFTRRLLDDKVKLRSIEALTAQCRDLTRLVEQRELDLLLRELFLVIDRIERHLDSKEDDFVRSVYEELLELLARREIVPVETEGSFDPETHMAVEAVASDEDVPPGRVVGVRRSGYRTPTRVLRAAEVVVSA